MSMKSADGSFVPTSPVGAGPGEVLTHTSHDRPIHELFEAQVRRALDAVAITDTAGPVKRRITFSDLNARANRIAASLLGSVGSGAGRVAIVLDDNVDVVAALLGVLKAGKTYVPLDPANPASRLEALAEHAQVEAVITDRRNTFETAQAPALDIATITEGEPADNPGITVDPSMAARIMYTSGSTGRPKGVIHSHRYLMQKTTADAGFLNFTSADRLSQTLPLSFAASTGHTFGALLSGATLCLYDPIATGIQSLAGWIQDEGITGLLLVPALFRRFLEAQPEGVTFPTVRYVMVGGDRVIHKDVELFRRHFPETSPFIHRFAATECGPIARFVIESDDEVPETVVPIGFATAGREVLVVDDDGTEVEPGTIGEMHLRAYDIADGYWGEPELTAAAFRPGPDGSRIYRTGDLGRVSPNGYLEHFGRKDQRVKVHGYGVDLLEIEKVLLGHPRVAEAVALARNPEGPEGGDTILAGYVVGGSDSAPEPAELRGYLADHLPAYSIPAYLVVLDEMPLTPRGKIDRAALSEPAATVTARPEKPPTDRIEKDLVAVWESGLGLSGIGVTDDFFDLGGTSVQALEVFAVMANRLGYDLPPSILLEAPTIEMLAARIRSGEGGATDRTLVPVRTQGNRAPIFFVHGGGGGVFFARDIAKHLRPDRPVYGVQAVGFEGPAPPYRSVEELAAIYAAEMRTLYPDGPYLLSGLSFGGLIAIEIAKWLQAAGGEIALLALLDTKHPAVDKGDEGGAGRHVERMNAMSGREKIGYVAVGAWNRMVRRPLRRRRVERHVRAGGPLPVEKNVRKWYFWWHHARAGRAYQASSIDIPLTIFSEEGASTQHETLWGPLATAGIDVREVHGNHDDLVREPVVEELAGLLQEAIDRADPGSERPR
jgi:amino acid adenylation domain-containing protein